MRNCELKEVYCGLFGSPARPPEVYFAPGRVNLIGEHIDYNGGLVMPAAISLGIRAAVSARSDNVVEMRSLNEEGAVRVVLDKEILFSERDGWGNYPKGVLKHLSDQGARLGGMNILFSGDLPVGAGLSSSAAIEVLTGYIILDQFGGEQVDGTRLALTCKEAENEFIGVNCGIMDQFTSAMGKEGRAILLDCATLDFEYLPVELGEFSLVIMNSNKKRALSESRYNERRSECDAALKLIASERKIENLCDARPCDVEELISDPVLRKRALHAVTENSRVKKAASALRGNDVAGF
ncbi:MAG: galactokinase, partial [Deltaproteobacteria bacterium]|nr:galactokinase [Deltaproteobacteria bacterium]